MAQRVFGIDLGAHSVKVAELELGFRSMQLVNLQTFAVLPGPESALDRALNALREAPHPDPADIVCVGVPGDRVLIRLFDVPFTDPRKIQAVVGNELADDVPWEMDEVVFDQLPSRSAGSVLVAAARREEVRTLLDRLSAVGFDPRQLRVASLSYAQLLRRVYGDQSVVMVDIGHLRSNICLAVDGRAVLGRTVSRGGHQLTEALRQTFHLGYAEAEQFKHDRGLIAEDPSELPELESRIAAVSARTIAPLAREVRRTIAVAGARAGTDPVRVVLCGGSAQLPGLDEYLAVETELPVERLDVAPDEELAQMELTEEAQSVGALALAYALEHGRRQNLDFRRGEFAFATDRSLLRDKAWTIALSLVALLFLGAFNAWASLYSLRAERDALRTRLEQATRDTFGASVPDPVQASRRVVRGAKAHGGEIPTGTAVDVLDRMSRSMPDKEKVKVDITRLDVKPSKTYVRGEAMSGSDVGKVIEALEEEDCFAEVSAGKISEVAEGKKQFSLTIQTKCF
jgi:general secretion pathway protein L